MRCTWTGGGSSIEALACQARPVSDVVVDG